MSGALSPALTPATARKRRCPERFSSSSDSSTPDTAYTEAPYFRSSSASKSNALSVSLGVLCARFAYVATSDGRSPAISCSSRYSGGSDRGFERSLARPLCARHDANRPKSGRRAGASLHAGGRKGVEELRRRQRRLHRRLPALRAEPVDQRAEPVPDRPERGVRRVSL